MILKNLILSNFAEVRKKTIWSADKIHLHHRFLGVGLSIKQTVIIFYAISAGFGIIALQSGTSEKMQAIWYLILIMAIIVIGLKIKKKYV